MSRKDQDLPGRNVVCWRNPDPQEKWRRRAAME